MAMEHWIDGQMRKGNEPGAQMGRTLLGLYGDVPSLTPEEDMSIVFGCTEDQIAHLPYQIRPDTKAYVGPLQWGILDKLKGIEHVYTSFPEGKIRRQTIEIGGKTAETLEAELAQAGINISSYAKDMLHSRDFTTLKEPQALDTVRLKVQDLGLTGTSTTDQVYARAKELGLELCPAEVGPHLRLIDTNQPLKEWYFIAMKQISDSDADGVQRVFTLERYKENGMMCLSDSWVGSNHRQYSGDEFVFCLRK